MTQKTNLRPGNASVGLQSLGGDRHGSVLGASNGGGVVTFRREVRFGKHRSEVHERREEEEGLGRGRETRRVCREAEDCQQEEIKCHKLLKNIANFFLKCSSQSPCTKTSPKLIYTWKKCRKLLGSCKNRKLGLNLKNNHILSINLKKNHLWISLGSLCLVCS